MKRFNILVYRKIEDVPGRPKLVPASSLMQEHHIDADDELTARARAIELYSERDRALIHNIKSWEDTGTLGTSSAEIRAAKARSLLNQSQFIAQQNAHLAGMLQSAGLAGMSQNPQNTADQQLAAISNALA